MANLDEMRAMKAAYDMADPSSEASPRSETMKAQAVRTAEIRAEHQRLNDRYQTLVNMFGQYVEMFEQWLAEHA